MNTRCIECRQLEETGYIGVCERCEDHFDEEYLEDID